MNEILLTISQALQLVALAPCIFVIAFLVATGRRKPENLLPLLYFLSLSCSFILPLLPIFGVNGEADVLVGVLMFAESLTAPLSFLLVMQFLKGKIPEWPYWCILALPIIGGSPFIYGTLYIDEVCFGSGGIDCYPTSAMRMLYNIFSMSMIFLLLIYEVSRSSQRIAASDIDRRHKYWLMVSLVSLNVMLGALDLMVLAGSVAPESALLAGTVIRIAFIYLVLTSIFRVFYELFDISMPGSQGPPSAHRDGAQDQAHVEKLKSLLKQDRIYREMGLTRKKLAQLAGLSEHQASRIINAYFHKNFNELINSYRIAEAKERLAAEESAITVIAFEVGFNSIPSFNRVFKELAGVSPSEFRSFHKNSVGSPT